MMKNNKNIYAVIRLAAKKSQSQMASTLKCSQSCICNYETGHRVPRDWKVIEKYLALAKKHSVQVTIRDLIGRDKF